MFAKTALTAAVLFAASTSAAAQMYKCTDANGKITYSQTQCAVDAAPVEVATHRPSAAQIQAHQAQVDANRQMINEGIARRQAQQEAAARARAAMNLEAARSRELATIQAKRSRAANNQAGATWLNALSNDATNVNEQYNAEMDRLRGVR